jgi:ABC-type antimicrobial peptide transport system permease subunit
MTDLFLAEFKHRKKRVVSTLLSFAAGILLLMLITSLSGAFKKVAAVPMETIGCNITVQRPGNVPEKMEGAIFPCAAVTIKKSEVEKIAHSTQVSSFGKAILLWVFDKTVFKSVLGIEPGNSVGPGLLKNCIVNGRFIESSGLEAVIDKAFADSRGIVLGQTIRLVNDDFTVVGVVDASRLGKLITANVYIPFSEASKIATVSEGIKSIAPFEIGDATILFMDVHQNQLKIAVKEIKGIMGEKTMVSSPLNMLENFKGIVRLFIGFSNILSLLVGIIAFLIITLTIMSSVNLRKNEFGILKAIGWTSAELRTSIMFETISLCFVGAVLGLVVSFLVLKFIGLTSIAVPIPWELNSATPHFLMDSPEEVIAMKLKLPALITLFETFLVLAGSCVTGAIIGLFSAIKVNKIKPSEAVKK